MVMHVSMPEHARCTSATAPELPDPIPNRIGGGTPPARSGRTFSKHRPADGSLLRHVARSDATDVDAAVVVARAAQRGWAATPPPERGRILFAVAESLEAHEREIAGLVAAETGKSPSEALGETRGAVSLARFMAGEGRRLYGRTTTSGSADKMAMTVREPIGVAGLIVAANTPAANVAWKVFPALISGNAAVLKPPEDAPATAWHMAALAAEAGLPPGVLNVVQGLGPEAGAALAAHEDVGVVSFTGSTRAGRSVQRLAGDRLARVSLELGGKNPFVVCEDADLDRAVRWAALSAFSNAGQRCAAASRLIVADEIYDTFRDALVERTRHLRVGSTDEDDLGPVISRRQLDAIHHAVRSARSRGAVLLVGGGPLTDSAHAGGTYFAPTLLDDVDPDDPISTVELFGPVACLYRVTGYAEALALANASPYGLTAAIHTRSADRALHFVRSVDAGVAVVNAGTYGSEPHMPFGGTKASGNGAREPGTEALDVYTSLKNVYMSFDAACLEAPSQARTR